MPSQRNFAAGFASVGWTAFIGVAFLPLYIRYLGFEAWGVVGFCITLQAWMSVVETGVSPALSREVARFTGGAGSAGDVSDLLRSTELLYAGAGVFLAFLLAAASPWLASAWLHSSQLDVHAISDGLRWMGAVIAALWLASLYRNALLGLQTQVLPYAVGAVLATFRAAATLFVLWKVSATIEAFAIVQLACAAIEAITLRRELFRRHASLRGGRWSSRSLRDFQRFATGLAGVALLATVLTQTDKLLLSTLLPLQEFGFVALAVTVATVLPVAAGPIFNLCYPRLSALTARAPDHEALAAEYHWWAQLLAVTVLPAAAVLAFFSQDFLALWTRDAQLASAVAPLLTLWLVGSALNAVMHVPYSAQLAHGWARLSLTINAVAVALLVPLTFWLVPRYGAVAAGWIWLVINAVYVVVGVSVMHRRILRGEAARWYAHSLLAPAIASAAVASAFAAWRHSQPQLGAAATIMLVGACAIVAVCAATLAAPLTRTAALARLRRGS